MLNSHKPDGGQIVQSNKICVILCSLQRLVYGTGIVSVDLKVLRHLLHFINHVVALVM